MSALPESHERTTLVVFRCGSVWLSAVVDAVEGVIPAPEGLTPVPHVAPCILGIFEYRGETATVVDVACKLGLDGSRVGTAGRAILVRGGAGLIAFLVDDLLDVAQAARFQWAEAPASVPGELFTATLSRDGHLILHTDFETLYRFPGPTALDAWVARLPAAQTAVEVGGAGPELVSPPETGEDELPPAIPAGTGSEAPERHDTEPAWTDAAPASEDRQPVQGDARPADHDPAETDRPCSAAEESQGASGTGAASVVEGGPSAPQAPAPAETAQTETHDDGETTAEVPAPVPMRPSRATAKEVVAPHRRAAEPPRLEPPLGRPRPVSVEATREAPPARQGGAPSLPELETVLSRLERFNVPIAPRRPPPPEDEDPSWLVRPDPRPARIVHRRPRTRRRGSWSPRIAALLAALVVTLNFPLIADLERQRAGTRAAFPVTTGSPPALPPAATSVEPMAPMAWRPLSTQIHDGLSDAPYLPWSIPVSGPPPFDPRRLRVHVVDRGETLWHLAERYLNDPWRYRELARLSNIRDPDLILPGEYIYYLRRD